MKTKTNLLKFDFIFLIPAFIFKVAFAFLISSISNLFNLIFNFDSDNLFITIFLCKNSIVKS